MWKKIVLAVLALVLSAAAFMVYKIGPRNVIGMLRYDQRRDGDLKVGDRAPEIALVALDGKARSSLLGDRTKPTVLIFGSFT
ncbi:MAG TPA: hypothetical protein VF787_12595 [Thermoanaerobaculia bacterium]